MPYDQISLPIDAKSVAKLAEHGLRMDFVDPNDEAQTEAWMQSTTRGFLQPQLNAEAAKSIWKGLSDRRTTGVWDDKNAEPDVPVATIDSFVSPVTLPGGGELPAWAISMVTVSATHRRRGIARALMEAELRAGAALGIPMAMLTASESSLYGRYGFGPATLAANMNFPIGHVKWTGPKPRGRVHHVQPQNIREKLDDLYAKARLASPGEVAGWPRRWDQIFGVTDIDTDVTKRPRAIRFDDEDGVTQGFAIFDITEREDEYVGHLAELRYLMANTADAYAGLWRYLIEMDLTNELRADLRSVDEPVRWMINDFRSVKVNTYEHLWLRILDVSASMSARPYFAPASLVIEVTDSLGYATGRYRLTTEGGSTEGVSTNGGPGTMVSSGDKPDLHMSVNELSALYLGGVSAVTLKRAGEIGEFTPGAAAVLDSALHSPVVPWLSTWF